MEECQFLATSLVQELTTTATKATNLLEILTGHARMIVNGLDNYQDAFVSKSITNKFQ